MATQTSRTREEENFVTYAAWPYSYVMPNEKSFIGASEFMKIAFVDHSRVINGQTYYFFDIKEREAARLNKLERKIEFTFPTDPDIVGFFERASRGKK